MVKKEEKECVNPIHKLEHNLKSSDIPLWIDRYNDIFSEFDSRIYSQRALSTDFLFEIRKASRDKETEKIEIKLFMPKAKREPKSEEVIVKRLKEHFKKHRALLVAEKNRVMTKGAIFIFVGVIIMFVAAYLVYSLIEKTLMFSFAIILLEPAGWFLFWEGLDLVLFTSEHKKPKLDFYKKIADCKITFLSY